VADPGQRVALRGLIDNAMDAPWTLPACGANADAALGPRREVGEQHGLVYAAVPKLIEVHALVLGVRIALRILDAGQQQRHVRIRDGQRLRADRMRRRATQFGPVIARRARQAERIAARPDREPSGPWRTRKR
jgi:hypothetical protein